MNISISVKQKKSGHATLSSRHSALLGEGARWCSQTGLLYWVDILGMCLYEFEPVSSKVRSWNLPKRVGCSAALRPGHRLLALEDGIYEINLASGKLSLLQRVIHPSPTHRFNDGAVDPLGRFWVGSFNEAVPENGELFCFHNFIDRPEIFGSNWGCLNGIGWSPDGKIMYVTDSREQKIWKFNYHLASGLPSNKEIFSSFSEGVPDGLCVDSEGAVWTALWDGGAVVRIDPNGRELQRIILPVRRPTSVALGGAHGKCLFITSASVNVVPMDDPSKSLDGSLFMSFVEVSGLPEQNIESHYDL